jgi:hypothetical protein
LAFVTKVHTAGSRISIRTPAPSSIAVAISAAAS